jgi:tRNA(Ser,Leu) C12 N-acetylase TAN1
MEWNVVITVYQDGFRQALDALRQLGPVERSPYHNVLIMQVDDPMSLLQAVERQTEETPALYDAISRVAPASRCFAYQSAEDFKDQAGAIVRESAAQLAGGSFYCRLHRRGDRHELRSPDVEKFLDDEILSATEEAGRPARMSFSDPDAVVAVDTVDHRAGISLWSRDQLARHPLLRPD